MREQCLICGDPLINAARGRKRVYCSVTCRRRRERVLARLRRTLARLEARKERYATPGNSYGQSQLCYLEPQIKQASEELGAELSKAQQAGSASEVKKVQKAETDLLPTRRLFSPFDIHNHQMDQPKANNGKGYGPF